jgi:hypothetical protein
MTKPVTLIFRGVQLPCIHGNVLDACSTFGVTITDGELSHLTITCVTCRVMLSIPLEDIAMHISVGDGPTREGAKA